MKKQFPEFYDSDHKALWSRALFVFDASVLLNLYRYSPQAGKEFISALEGYRDRIWLPHQFGFEYHKNRLARIQEQQTAYDSVIAALRKGIDAICGNLNQHSKHAFIATNEISKQIKGMQEKALKSLEDAKRRHPDWVHDDPIRDDITRVFSDRVGNPFPEERMIEIQHEGEARYKTGVPPGYKDASKSENCFGDLIGWFQTFRILFHT